MNIESWHGMELEFIRWLHQFRTPLIDHFERLFDFFDRQEFFFVLIPAVWVAAGWKSGLRLFYILFLSTLCNYVLKLFFGLPRPFHLDPALGVIQVSGFGLPSGAAQNVILFSGILLSYHRNFWTFAVSLIYILSVSFSRVYLGVHFPSDILGGWMVGFLLWLFYVYGIPSIERRLEWAPGSLLCLIGVIVPGSMIFFLNGGPVMPISSVAVGLSLGLFRAHFFNGISLPENGKQALFRAILAVGGTFLSYGLVQFISFPEIKLTLFFRFFYVGLWLSLGCYGICRWKWVKKNNR